MNLNHKIYGEGEPIIILHGMMGMLDNWQTVARKLAEEYMVILVDLRNHGKSPHTSEHSYALMAEDLHEFMEQQWIHEATIIGHSMGGKTAIEFAKNYSDMINHLIVVDISPKENKAGHGRIFEALHDLPLDKIENRGEAEAFLAEYIEEAGVRLFLLKNLQRKKEGGYRWKMNLEAIFANYQEVLNPIEIDEPISTPTLFIRGERSNYILEEDIPTLQEQFTKMEVVTLDAGHWIHAERPSELIHAVKTFISI